MRIALAGAVLLAGCMHGGAGEPEPAGDACGAAERAGLVGSSVDALDPATLPEGARIIRPGMAVTMDFNPERLNVDVGEEGLITRLWCG